MLKLVDDDLWAAVRPLLPRHADHPRGGRPFADDRDALAGIIFVLRTGIPWKALPAAPGLASGSTCWRRLRDWQAAGVWQALHEELLARLNGLGAIDWSRASADARSVPAKRGASSRAPARWTGASRAANTT